ncbi:efflux RND transporter periplasmic adaptor subunit [bacterium]|nr:efflux RND transporter periplasmic adaptor subunit [bacterium]
MKKKLFIGLGILLVIALFVVLNLQKQKGKATEAQVEDVEARDLTELVSASGKIQPKVSVDVSADITGKIVAVAVEEGDTVRTGDLLIRIDPTQIREAVRSAEAQHLSARASLEEARASLEQQQLEWQRAQGLHSSASMSDREFESKRAAFKLAEARLVSAERSVDQAAAYLEQQRDQLAKTEIRAPMAGVVVRRNADPGEIAIQSSLSIQVLMVIADLSVMEVEVDVDETEIPQVAIGQAAEIEIDAFPDSIFPGRVTEIANSPRNETSNQGVDFRVVITLAEGLTGLRPGLSATAEITTAQRDSVLSIPIQALTLRTKKALEDDEKRFGPQLAKAGVKTTPFTFGSDVKELEGVFIEVDGRALFRAVETGIAGDKHFELIEGLAEGEKIVVGPMKAVRTLRHGERIKATAAKDEVAERHGNGVSVSVETD